MPRSLLAGALALALTAVPGLAQERSPTAQMGFLDVGQSAVVIPISMVQQKPDRIELAMTAAEVKDALDKQKP